MESKNIKMKFDKRRRNYLKSINNQIIKQHCVTTHYLNNSEYSGN